MSNPDAELLESKYEDPNPSDMDIPLSDTLTQPLGSSPTSHSTYVAVADSTHCAWGKECKVGSRGGPQVCHICECPIHLLCFHTLGGQCEGSLCVCDQEHQLRCYNHFLDDTLPNTPFVLSSRPSLSSGVCNPGLSISIPSSSLPPVGPGTPYTSSFRDDDVEGSDDPRTEAERNIDSTMYTPRPRQSHDEPSFRHRRSRGTTSYEEKGLATQTLSGITDPSRHNSPIPSLSSSPISRKRNPVSFPSAGNRKIPKKNEKEMKEREIKEPSSSSQHHDGQPQPSHVASAITTSSLTSSSSSSTNIRASHSSPSLGSVTPLPSARRSFSNLPLRSGEEKPTAPSLSLLESE